jgi:tetratricopeptide (TPR) repeat protein
MIMPQKMPKIHQKQNSSPQVLSQSAVPAKATGQPLLMHSRMGNQALQRMLKADAQANVPGDMVQRETTAADDTERLHSIFNVAETFYKAEAYSDAAINYTKLLQFDSLKGEQRAQILYNVGQCQRNLKRYANAIPYYEEAVQIGAGAFQKKAEYFLKVCREELGITMVNDEDVLHVGLDDAKDLFVQADEAYKGGNYKDALALYLQVQQYYPDASGMMYFNMGQCNRNLKRWATALYFYERSLEYDIGVFEGKATKFIAVCQKHLGGLPESS